MLWLAGLGLLMLVSSEPERWTRAGRLGLSFGLGLLALPHALFLASCLGRTPDWWIGIGVALLLWLAARALRGRGLWSACLRASDASPAPRPAWRRTLDALLLGLVAAVCALVGLVALAEPLVEWDVLAIWAYKARLLLHEPLSRSDFLYDPTRAYAHLDYPLLWPFAIGWIWNGAGAADLLAPKWLSPALLASLAMTFHALLARSGDRSSALLFTALLLCTPMLLSQSVRLQADVPLAFFTTAAGGSLYLWLRRLCEDGVRLAGLFACAVLLTKNEGMAVYAVLLLAGALATWSSGDTRMRRSAALWLALLPALVTGAWFWLRAGIPQLHEDYASRLDASLVWQNAGRIPGILAGALDHLSEPSDWLLLWPALALLLLASVRVWRRSPALLFLLAVAELPVCIYAAILVVTPWEPRTLMEASFSRLLLHTFPLQLLLAAEITRSAGWLPWLDPPRAQG